jgi:hypothetical protein
MYRILIRIEEIKGMYHRPKFHAVVGGQPKSSGNGFFFVAKFHNNTKPSGSRIASGGAISIY